MDTTTMLDASESGDAQRQPYVPPEFIEYGNAKTITEGGSVASAQVDGGTYLS